MPLPAGLTFNPSTGAITGTPTTAGTSTFGIRVTDAVGATAVLNSSIVVSPSSVFGNFVSRKRVLGKSGSTSGSSLTGIQVIRATAPTIDAVRVILHINQVNLPGSVVKMTIAPSAKAGYNPVDANDVAVTFTPVTFNGQPTLNVVNAPASADGGQVEMDYISDKITLASLQRADVLGALPLFHARIHATSYVPMWNNVVGGPDAVSEPDYVNGTVSGDQTSALLGATPNNTTFHIPMTWVFYHAGHRVMSITTAGDSTMQSSWSTANAVDGASNKFNGFPRQFKDLLVSAGILTSIEQACLHGEQAKNFHEVARNALLNLDGEGLTHVFLYPYSVNDGGNAAASVFEAAKARTLFIIDLAVSKNVKPILIRNPPGYETGVGQANGYNEFFDAVATAGKAIVWDMRPPMGLAASGYPVMPDAGRLHDSSGAVITSDSHPNNYFHATVAAAMFQDRVRLKFASSS